MTICISYGLLLMIIHVAYGDLTSTFQFLSMGTDFIPANPVELRGVVTPVQSRLICAMYCNQDLQCRTIVFSPPFCRLYETYLNTGSVFASSSSQSVVGAVNYARIHLSSAYNQSCDHCYLDRYLVCRNNTCQCPLNTFWDGQNTCCNQLFVNSSSSCVGDGWCRGDLNLTCQYGKCQSSTQNSSGAPLALTQVFWSFDSNVDDQYKVYNGVTMNNPTYVSPGYTGYGSALSLDASQSQYVLVPQFFNMTYTSFTWELWAYPRNLGNLNGDNLMVGFCESLAVDRCFYLMIRNNMSYFAFWGDDCPGSTVVNVNQWHHFAFVYDYSIRTQYIYFNGQLDCMENSTGPFQGYTKNITIGAIQIPVTATPISYWTGYIDQLSYVSRAKTQIEVLTDATLVAYYSFDNASYDDLGPNKMNGIGVNVSSVAGRVKQGILFNASQAYFQANGFTFLGTSYRSYSIALWIYRFPASVGNGTIVHLAGNITGVPAWCMPIVGLSSSGQITIQSYNISVIAITGPILPFGAWTHVVSSYKPSRGISLWVNGSFFNSSGPFNYVPSNLPSTIVLGTSAIGAAACVTGPIIKGQLYGMIDEFRVYSRELSASEVFALANAP